MAPGPTTGQRVKAALDLVVEGLFMRRGAQGDR